MASIFKTPGVYIDEKNAFPNSVVAVETAVPAFIGYTEMAKFNGQSLHNKPVRIDSFMDFEQFYGKGLKTTYSLNEISDPKQSIPPPDLHVGQKTFRLKADPETLFYLYDALRFFYQNGGGSCFIVSVGTYKDGVVNPAFSTKPFTDGITLLEKETEPTMLVIPDVVLLEAKDCYSVQRQMLDHCGIQQNRVAILDVHDGYVESDPVKNPIDDFRKGVSSDFLNYGAAYYPWLNTTILQESDVGHLNLNAKAIAVVKRICSAFIDKLEDEDAQNALKPFVARLGVTDSITDTNSKKEPKTKGDTDEVKRVTKVPSAQTTDRALSLAIPQYKHVMEALLKKKNLLPPSAAMAGIYSLTDSTRGVWKSPANVAVNGVVSPSVLIDYNQQQYLNAPILGKSICAIRPFIGLGTMVWGARTLDANSLDWRYINVRRTMIMMEQSIKFAAKAYVFEPNVKSTWVSVEGMISNFLTNLWKQGGLAGAVPADAFSVNVGLGTTMTANDILVGIMRIEVKVAVSRPAEFIVITFEQQMQKS